MNLHVLMFFFIWNFHAFATMELCKGRFKNQNLMLRFLNYINMLCNKSDLKYHSLIIGVLIYLGFLFITGQTINSWNSWILSYEAIRDKECVYYAVFLGTCCTCIWVGQDTINIFLAELGIAARAGDTRCLWATLPHTWAGLCGVWAPTGCPTSTSGSLCRSQCSQVPLDPGGFWEEALFAWLCSLFLISRKATPAHEQAWRTSVLGVQFFIEALLCQVKRTAGSSPGTSFIHSPETHRHHRELCVFRFPFWIKKLNSFSPQRVA